MRQIRILILVLRDNFCSQSDFRQQKANLNWLIGKAGINHQSDLIQGKESLSLLIEQGEINHEFDYKKDKVPSN